MPIEIVPDLYLDLSCARDSYMDHNLTVQKILVFQWHQKFQGAI